MQRTMIYAVSVYFKIHFVFFSFFFFFGTLLHIYSKIQVKRLLEEGGGIRLIRAISTLKNSVQKPGPITIFPW